MCLGGRGRRDWVGRDLMLLLLLSLMLDRVIWYLIVHIYFSVLLLRY